MLETLLIALADLLIALAIIALAILATMYDNELQDFIDKIEGELDD